MATSVNEKEAEIIILRLSILVIVIGILGLMILSELPTQFKMVSFEFCTGALLLLFFKLTVELSVKLNSEKLDRKYSFFRSGFGFIGVAISLLVASPLVLNSNSLNMWFGAGAALMIESVVIGLVSLSKLRKLVSGN